ncbi:MAG TPA: nucleotidyltransferase family protein [Pyrinomonadaceae bacterium]|nr:nucleotidyltransferase family protein [Pyrinomonadaceae bacterium]
MTSSYLGRLVSKTLARSWIASGGDLLITEQQLGEVTPLLYESGAAGLGWWRIRESELRQTPSGELLHQAFRFLALQARIHETKIEKVFRLLRAAGIEPILIKGWSIARLYPQPGLRPYGDIDLIIKPEQHLPAVDIAASEELRDCQIDFHPGAFELADRSIGDLLSRSHLVQCSDEEVRILGNEDHFALLAIHLLKHGAWRPLWLCDLGLLLDRVSSDFDWELCLGKDNRRRNWILSAIGLARALLGASINDEEIGAQANAPTWLVDSVLKNWETPFAGAHAPHHHRAPIKSYLRRPRGVIGDLARRWPDPILATISANGTFGPRRRLRYQIQNCVQRAARLGLRDTQPA